MGEQGVSTLISTVGSIVFWVVTGILSALSGRLIMEFKRLKALRDAVCVLLYDRMNQKLLYHLKQGTISLGSLELVGKMYNAYYCLGACADNEALKSLYDRVKDLPVISGVD